ncbi:MAG: 5-formyltetrahydrofolate cyclo-ligase [Clostridiales bacterium GWB2_37_7]|nr:MAG: 5-formyltetrahydrofolate cyclo-ligase [Clostridiales bacterium GWB2_37_7]
MSKDQKKLIRTSVLKKRNSLTPAEINKAERQIMVNLMKLDQFINSQNIFCYLSFRSEVPTQSIIEHCQQQGKNVYIPICITETKEMVITKYDSDVKLETSNYGVQEPSKSTIKLADRNILDTSIMPGAVFDAKGYRIGYGAGYYDKFFSHIDKQIYKIALAFSFQVIDEVPKDEYDIPVDCIVTEQEIITCSR